MRVPRQKYWICLYEFGIFAVVRVAQSTIERPVGERGVWGINYHLSTPLHSNYKIIKKKIPTHAVIPTNEDKRTPASFYEKFNAI